MLMYGKSRYARTNEGGQHRERIVEELKQNALQYAYSDICIDHVFPKKYH